VTPGFQTDSPDQYLVTVVRDDGNPSLSDTNSFSVTVTGHRRRRKSWTLAVTNGIVTLHWTRNRGTQLSAWSTKDYLDDADWNVWVPTYCSAGKRPAAQIPVGVVSQDFIESYCCRDAQKLHNPGDRLIKMPPLSIS